VGVSEVRFTVRQMVGVVVIVALLMPGVICVVRADAFLRWTIAVMMLFLYLIASPGILAAVATFFRPERDR
jgi:hypothetical protein